MVVEDGCDETEELFCIAAEKMEKNQEWDPSGFDWVRKEIEVLELDFVLWAREREEEGA